MFSIIRHSTRRDRLCPAREVYPLLALLLPLILASCRAEADKEVLASIGKYSVTDVHFQNAFRSYYHKTGKAIPVNESTLKAVLDAELERYTVVTWAEQQGWHLDAEGTRQHALIERQVLMQEYERLLVHDGVGADEDDLRELFRRYNTRVRASHLYAPDRSTADSLYARLQNGEDFGELAAEVFSNKHLSESGGDLGFFTIDEMDPAFENVAFRMQPGEISPPVRTNQGFSIIKVTDVVGKPIVTETEFTQRRAALMAYATERNREMATRRDLENLTSEVVVDQQVLDRLFQAMDRTAEGSRFDVGMPETTVVARLRDHTLTLQEFRAEASLLSDARFASQRALKEIIEGLAYRSYAIRSVKEHPRYDSNFVALTIQATFHSWLIDRFNTYLEQTVEVPERELLALYRSNEEYRTSALELNLSELVAASESDALEAIELLRSGSTFKTVLLRYGVMGEALLYDGELGFRPVDSFGKFAPDLRGLAPGGIAGPFEYTPDRWIVYLCSGRREPAPMEFEKARPLLSEVLKAEEVKQRRGAIIRQTQKDHGAKADYEKMKTVTITI